MADNEEKKIISVQLDESAKNKAIRGIADVQNALKKAGAEAPKLGSALLGAAKATQSVDNAQKDLSRSFQTGQKHLQEQIRSLDTLEDKAKSAGNAISNIPSASGGDIGSSVGQIRGAVSTFGGSSTGAGLEVASGIGDAVEAFGSLNPAVLASTAAIVALSVVMNAFTVDAQKQADAINNIIDAQRAVNEAVVGGLTTEEAQARLAELEELRAREQELLDANTAAYEQALNAISDRASGALGGIAAPLLDTLGLTEGAVQQISAQEEALNSQIQTSQGNIASYNAEINALNRQIESGSIAANDIEAAESELAATRENEAQAAIAAAEQAAQRVAAAQQQIADLQANRAIAAANAEASSALEARFIREDDKAEESAHRQNLVDIANAGRVKIEAINQELSGLGAKQAEAIAAAQAKGNQQLSKLQSDYFANQIKATQDFAKSQGRIVSDTAKAAKRLAEDIADNLNDAVRSNDVVAFLNIQRDGNKELRRNAEDAKEEERRAVEDFIAGQEEQRQAFQARQAEIMAGIEQERQAIAQSFAERKMQLEQQRQAEIANTQAALASAKTRYEQGEAQEDLAASRNAQRLALRQQQEDAAFQRQLAAIQSRIAAESQVESAFMGGISRIIAAASAMGKASSSAVAKSFTGAPGMGGYQSPYQSGGFLKSGASNNTTINMTVGDVATGQMVLDAANQVKQQVYGTMIGAMSGAS